MTKSLTSAWPNGLRWLKRRTLATSTTWTSTWKTQANWIYCTSSPWTLRSRNLKACWITRSTWIQVVTTPVRTFSICSTSLCLKSKLTRHLCFWVTRVWNSPTCLSPMEPIRRSWVSCIATSATGDRCNSIANRFSSSLSRTWCRNMAWMSMKQTSMAETWWHLFMLTSETSLIQCFQAPLLITTRSTSCTPSGPILTWNAWTRLNKAEPSCWTQRKRDEWTCSLTYWLPELIKIWKTKRATVSKK